MTIFACGNGVAQAPCASTQANAARQLQQSANQMQAVIGIQQQAARNALQAPPKLPLNALAKEDSFTVSSINAIHDANDSVVASLSRTPSNPNKIALRFPGEMVAYSIHTSVYEAFIKEKKITPIGAEFVAIPHPQVSQIKSLVIGGISINDLMIKVNNDQIELVAKNRM